MRDDGSTTWQKQESRNAPFFASHDLTHFAVESVLGFRQGFFGLVAKGWDIEDTTGKGERGRLPDEAVHVESIVGALDSERASGDVWPSEDFNRHLAIHAETAGMTKPRLLADEELSAVRLRRAELFARWRALPAGETLELHFGVQPTSPML